MGRGVSGVAPRRVAIIHFTGPEEIGGIESWIGTQMACLERRGISVRLIVGGGDGFGDDTVHLPAIHPVSLANEINDLAGFPSPGHPIVQTLARTLRAALRDCTDCWVHNAFSVFLNPFLTAALQILAAEARGPRWVAWCEDISSTSAYWDALGAKPLPSLQAIPGVTYVTISEARRRELANVLDLPPEQITVIPPPVDTMRFLGAGTNVRVIAAMLDLVHAMPVVLVPAKLLPHKNLARCVDVAAALRDRCDRPMMLLTGAPSPHEPSRSRALAESLRRQARGAGVEDCFVLLHDLAGPLEYGDVRDLMLLSDVVFLASTEEGYGLPLREAAALRAPILCSRIPAFQEAGAGPFFDVDDSAAEIAQMILGMAAAPGNVARRGVLEAEERFQAQLAELLDPPPSRRVHRYP